MKGLAFATVLAILVSGCARNGSDDGSGPGVSTGSSGAPSDSPAYQRPEVWSAGSWWNYSVAQAGGSGSFTLVVTQNATDAYVLDTDNRTLALFDAKTDVSYVGPIEKKNLAGAQAGRTVEYFRFPFEAGATWNTTWDGVTRTIHAVGPGPGGFLFEAVENGKVRVRYSYDAASGFFGHLDFLGDDGSVRFGIALRDHGNGFAGNVVRASNLVLWADNGTSGEGVTGTFVPPPGAAEILFQYSMRCNATGTPHSILVGPEDPQGAQTQGYHESFPCPSAHAGNYTWAPPAPGTWRYALSSSLSADAPWSVLVEAHTYTTIPVAAA